MKEAFEECQTFMDDLIHIPCLKCNCPNAIFYDYFSYLSHICEVHLDNEIPPLMKDLLREEFITSSKPQERKILKPKRKNKKPVDSNTEAPKGNGAKESHKAITEEVPSCIEISKSSTSGILCMSQKNITNTSKNTSENTSNIIPDSDPNTSNESISMESNEKPDQTPVISTQSQNRITKNSMKTAKNRNQFCKYCSNSTFSSKAELDQHMDQCHKIRSCANHDQGCLCSVEHNDAEPETRNPETKSVQTAITTRSERSTQTGKTIFGQEIHELEENAVIATNERDLLAQELDCDIETSEQATQTEAEPSSNPLELQELHESLIIAVNERDLFVEENENLERRLDFLTENYNEYVENHERLVEDYEVLYQVNEQRQQQVQDEIEQIWRL